MGCIKAVIRHAQQLVDTPQPLNTPSQKTCLHLTDGVACPEMGGRSFLHPKRYSPSQCDYSTSTMTPAVATMLFRKCCLFLTDSANLKPCFPSNSCICKPDRWVCLSSLETMCTPFVFLFIETAAPWQIGGGEGRVRRGHESDDIFGFSLIYSHSCCRCSFYLDVSW